MKWIWDAIEIGKWGKLEKVFDKSRNKIANSRKVQFSNWIALGHPHYFRWLNCEVVFLCSHVEIIIGRSKWFVFTVWLLPPYFLSKILFLVRSMVETYKSTTCKMTKKEWTTPPSIDSISKRETSRNKRDFKWFIFKCWLNFYELNVGFFFFLIFFYPPSLSLIILPLICLYSIELKLLVLALARQNTVIN